MKINLNHLPTKARYGWTLKQWLFGGSRVLFDDNKWPHHYPVTNVISRTRHRAFILHNRIYFNLYGRTRSIR